MSENTSKVTEFYANKNIFITGGTGFLGIALIEKFLRDLPNCGKLYLLMRPKKQKSIEQRLEDMTKNLVFEKLLETESPEIFKKLIPINGDVSEEDLGISPEDRQFLIDNINVVFHSAATLDFQQSLKPTVNINLLGTRRVMELCCEMKKLEACVHVSSAYVNSYLLETEEILYPAPEEAQKVIDLVDSLNEGALKQIEPKLLRDHPNTYTFTKHLAEHEVQKCANRFPCGIVRPSMITAAWKEPVPGWTNSKNGPQGFFMGSSRGVIRRLPLGSSLVYDYIPVDTVVNHMIVTGQHINSLKSGSTNPELTIFHCTSGTYKPFRWEMIKDKINEQMHEFPLKSAVWYPHLKFVESLTLFKISAIFVHFLPAYILDFVTKIAGGRPILVKLHTNVWNSLKLLEKFIFTEWKFHNTKALALMKSMTRADQEKFNMDIGELKWDEYFGLMVRGVRRYLSNEDPKTLEAARKKDQILLVLHIVLQALIMFGVWWTSSSLFGLSLAKSGIVVLIFYILFSKL